MLIELEKNCIRGLRKLREAGFLLIIISNQSGVAHGFFKEDALNAVEGRIRELLQKENIELDGFYYCPHHPEGKIKEFSVECACRKPKPGMILQAASDFNIDLAQSWMIGDILNDMEAGKKAGCHTILIDNNNETEWLLNEFREPDFTALNINEAAGFILKPIKVLEKHERSLSSYYRSVSSG